MPMLACTLGLSRESVSVCQAQDQGQLDYEAAQDDAPERSSDEGAADTGQQQQPQPAEVEQASDGEGPEDDGITEKEGNQQHLTRPEVGSC